MAKILHHYNIMFKLRFLPVKYIVFMLSMLLVGCDNFQKWQKNTWQGCYSVQKNAPAQIKISQNQGKYFMQMKEPKGAKSAWDSPEILLQSDDFSVFKNNSLGVQAGDISAMLIRQDKVLALAKVDSNLGLDSAVIASLFGAVATIYPVACDNTPIEYGSAYTRTL